MGSKKLILGTVQLGLDYGINNSTGKPSKEESIALLSKAYELGIRILDTAEGYGDANEIIKEYHFLHPQNKFDVITKKSFQDDGGFEDDYFHKLNQSLSIQSLFAFLFHNFKSFAEDPERLKFLIRAKKRGDIKKIGVSIYTNEELKKVIENEKIDLIQVPFNLLDNKSQRGALLKTAKEKNKIIQVRSIFLQGLFYKDTESLPEKLKTLFPYLNEIKQLKDNYQISTEQLCLNYAFQSANIDLVTVGIDSKEQLINNVELAQQKIPDQLVEEIDHIQVNQVDLLYPINWT